MSGSHDHAHGHAHGHDHHGHDHHGHSHAPPKDFSTAFIIGIVLNLGFVAVEAAYGFLANSVALLADAGHNLSDVAGLAAAWGATALAKRAASERFTYGMRSSSILAALFNAVLLLVAVGAIALEAIRRLGDPQPVGGVTVMAVAAAGIAVNGVTAWLFARGREGDINVRAAFAHMMSDALVSAGVVVAGFVILETGWTWLDPIVSLVIAATIIWGTWGLLRDSMTLALQGVPPGVELDAVRSRLAALPGVAQTHHVHIWPVSTTETALTAHLLCPAGHPGDAFLCEAAHMLEHDFGIGHATFQIELVAGSCA
ncbi:cation diffusion facilitator family transporter [Polymorphobacter sp. PAMC 29334]|uniref:cation diffusion facilitator family transporter n=1 Tax=Polymorphobacter sp. PAMC 29334 TaxID=2862331 RepID=UPI001C682022|nr:cation diffusion facilitator family transporter [Polymorphobacter sp. PAMC 29334]QYE35800.1 cation diffusion facilitator family transporter [Polymorphobacter sp. PAMC 29334]